MRICKGKRGYGFEIYSQGILAFSKVTISYFSAIEKPVQASALTYSELVIQFLLMLTLPRIMGLPGVWLSVPASQVCACLLAVIVRKEMR